MTWLSRTAACRFAPRCLKGAVEERLFARRRDLLTRLDLLAMEVAHQLISAHAP